MRLEISNNFTLADEPAPVSASTIAAPVRGLNVVDDFPLNLDPGADPLAVQTIANPDTAEGFRSSQTLRRGLDILDVIAGHAPLGLRELGAATGLSRSTTCRLAAALIERDFVRSGEKGYTLGVKLMALADRARQQRPLILVARHHLESLSRAQLDPVNLAVRDGSQVRYVDQVRGARRIEVRSVVGETRPLATTALGRALMLDETASQWRTAFETRAKAGPDTPALGAWLARMEHYRRQGAAFDIEENEDRIRCVAAPVRDASGQIVAAISLSSLPQYMDDARLQALVEPVRRCATLISAELGWRLGDTSPS